MPRMLPDRSIREEGYHYLLAQGYSLGKSGYTADGHHLSHDRQYRSVVEQTRFHPGNPLKGTIRQANEGFGKELAAWTKKQEEKEEEGRTGTGFGDAGESRSMCS